MNRKRDWTALAGAAVPALAATPVVAQDEEAPAETMDAETIEVTAIEYAFTGLPESVPTT